MTDTASIASIYRYPVKGLTPERLDQVALSVGQTLPSDRRYAIENGPSGFDPAAPQHLPKFKFLMLMRNERLAALRTHYDDTSHVLTIGKDGAELLRANLETPDGRAAVEQFFAMNFADELKGPPRLVSSDGFSFSDVARKVVSIINLNSVKALEGVIGQQVHPLRFRGNLYVAGWPAWREFELMDKVIAIGDARLKVVKRIVRCAATNVDPETAARDLAIPATLMQTYGHADLGVYAEVIEAGAIAEGDSISVKV
ncbi:MOSC domain-containing protein [soil metagenome]